MVFILRKIAKILARILARIIARPLASSFQMRLRGDIGGEMMHDVIV
jgi:hypothetical protein